MQVSFAWVEMACGFWNRLVIETHAHMLRTALTENLVDRDSYGSVLNEMMTCLLTVYWISVPEYAERLNYLFI